MKDSAFILNVFFKHFGLYFYDCKFCLTAATVATGENYNVIINVKMSCNCSTSREELSSQETDSVMSFNSNTDLKYASISHQKLPIIPDQAAKTPECTEKINGAFYCFAFSFVRGRMCFYLKMELYFKVKYKHLNTRSINCCINVVMFNICKFLALPSS